MWSLYPVHNPATASSAFLSQLESAGHCLHAVDTQTACLPAGLTLEEFLLVLNTGADVKHRPPFVPSEENDLLQVMPWPVFGKMTDREKRAIYEYLRAIPCLGSTARCTGG